MKIAVIMASSGVSDEGMEDRRRFLQGSVAPGTEVVMIPNLEAPPAIVDAYESHQAALHVTQRAREVEAMGFDAAVVWCGDDPGLEAARQRVAIPVVGPASASLALATAIADRFGYVSSAGSTAHIERRVRAAGLGDRLAAVACLSVEVLDIRADVDRTLSLAEAAIREGIDGGAQAFIVGCMAMYGMAAELTRRTGAPVIDGGQAAVIVAEGLVRMGIGHSKFAYPTSPSGASWALAG